MKSMQQKINGANFYYLSSQMAMFSFWLEREKVVERVPNRETSAQESMV
jgi:hypothetical protein